MTLTTTQPPPLRRQVEAMLGSALATSHTQRELPLLVANRVA
ncbi:MAG: hypothetical protein WBE17_11520 [Anaerolineae bacterium]